jgi:hypothetical protein
MRRCVVIASVFLAFATAAAAATPNAPAGFRRHALGAGLSVALPIGWQVVASRDAGSPGVLQSLRQLDPTFAAPIAQLASADSPLKLFAFDRSFWHHRATTAMLLKATVTAPGAYRRWSAKTVAELRQAPGRIGAISHARVRLPGGPALRAGYRTSTGDAVTLYFVAGGDGLWALVFRVPAAHAAVVAPLFRRTAATLVLPPTTSKPGP